MINKPSNDWRDDFKLIEKPARTPQRSITQAELRSEQQWREHHENKEPNHWQTIGNAGFSKNKLRKAVEDWKRIDQSK